MEFINMNKKTVKRTVNIIASERTRGERFRKCVNCRTRLAPKEGSKNLVYFCPKCGLHFNVRDTSPELKLGTAFGGVKNNGETGIVAQKTNNTNFKKSTNKQRKENDFLLKKELARKDKNNNFDFLGQSIGSQAKITFAKILNPKERKYRN